MTVVYVPFILFSIHSVIFSRLFIILCSAAPLKLPTLSEVEAVSEEQFNPLTPSTTHHCRLLSALVASVDRSKSVLYEITSLQIDCRVFPFLAKHPSIAQVGAAQSEVRVGLRYAVRLGLRY